MKNLTALVLLASSLSAPAQEARMASPVPDERGIVINAADMLPPALLQGPAFRVRNQVVTDGFMAHFEIDTDFGTFSAIGVPAVKSRIAEAEAIKVLVATSKSDLFAEGLKRSVTQPIDAVKNIIDDPVESVKKAPKTVGHFLGKIGSSIERGASKVSDKVSGEGPRPDAGQVGRGIGEAAKNAAGFDKAKLDTAKQLGVDPYSDNTRLQQEMDKVTWAFFAGGLPLRIGAAVASAGISLTATNMVGVPEDTYALTQSELALRDKQALTAMGVSEELITGFQISDILSTTRRHRIVTALGKVKAGKGASDIVELANQCTTPEQADFLVSSIELLTNGKGVPVASFDSLQVLGRLPCALSAKGDLFVAVPVDYVTWTPEVAAFATRDDIAAPSKTLIHTGLFSDKAEAGISASGWKSVALDYP